MGRAVTLPLPRFTAKMKASTSYIYGHGIFTAQTAGLPFQPNATLTFADHAAITILLSLDWLGFFWFLVDGRTTRSWVKETKSDRVGELALRGLER